MPRQTVRTIPRERLTLPAIRKAWGQLEPVTLTRAARELHLTIDMLKNRRRSDSTGTVFPTPIPVEGHWRQSGVLFDMRLMQMWDDCGFDLRKAPPAKLGKLLAQIEKVAAKVEPIILTSAAEVLIAEVLPDLAGRELAQATAAVAAYRKQWETAGAKPELPTVLGRAQRRLRTWRESESSGFPAALPVDAEYRTGEMYFSLPELRAWLAERGAAS